MICRCLDKAATRRGPKQRGKEEGWLYTVTQVEEVKRMVGFLPIMIATIIFNTGDCPLNYPCGSPEVRDHGRQAGIYHAITLSAALLASGPRMHGS